MEIIKSIQIKKFRSIKSLTKNFSPTSLNIFVGQNDKGKSNILRALNLFFNGQTDNGIPLRFEDDYCYHSGTGTGTRKEIRIELIIQPPPRRFKNSKPIRWVKRWKKDNELIESRIYVSSGEELASSSNVYKWLNKIRYRYVPAIKGQNYFTRLMGKLYEVLNEVHEDTMKTQGNDFITGIQTITDDITRELNNQIGISNSIQVPSDFKLLFSNLDFGSKIDGKVYHLKQRGDGIKIRHIPVILKYMCDLEKKISIPGYVKPDTIWGFEEPENNLEMTYAFDLAEKFVAYSQDIQIFLTTHSPAFYAITQDELDCINTYYIDQNTENCTTLQMVNPETQDDIHGKMGLLQFAAPYLKEIHDANLEITKLTEKIDLAKLEIDCFVLTEDSKYDQLLKYFEINGFDINKTEFVSYETSSHLPACFPIAKYLLERRPNSKIVIHRDRDYLEDEEISKLKQRIKKDGYYPYITDGVDVESNFVNPEHICELYPSMDLEEVQRIINQATKEAEKDSTTRMVDLHFCKIKRPINNAFSRERDMIIARYQSNPIRYRYGKKVYNLVRSMLQGQLKINPDLIKPSSAIVNPYLKKISNEIWEDV